MRQTHKVFFKNEAQKELLKGAQILADAVGSTMGPSGHSVIIDSDTGNPLITKDGVTVARSINLKNRLQSIGAELLKEIAGKTNELAGDGTTTATVLGYHLLHEGHKLVSTGRSSIDIKYGMDKATNIVLDFLKENCVPVSCKQDIVNVGTISANGDVEIGELLAEAIDKVGVDGMITIEPASSVKTTLNLAEGIQLNAGFVSPFFITNNERQTCELEDPYVLITTGKISSIAEILPALEQTSKANKPLLIVADEIEGEALHTLVVNKTKGIIKVCGIKAPSYGEHRSDLLADLSVVVGGMVLGATSEVSIKNIKLDNMGKCKKVIVNRNSCTFLVNNADSSERIKARAEEIKHAMMEDHTLDDLRLSKFRERLARLSGGIAVIKVGGSTEVEIKEKKDRVEDAVNATQAAAQRGIVPGGGTALYYAAQHLRAMIKSGYFAENMTEDHIAGVNLIANVCETPFRTIVSNTGVSPDVVSDKLKQNWSETQSFSVDMTSVSSLSTEEVKDFLNNLVKKQNNNSVSKGKFRFGYNAANKTYCDLVEQGVIDPVLVTACALEHAVSVVGLTLTCNAVVINEEEDES